MVEDGSLPLEVVVAGFAFGWKAGGDVINALGVGIIGFVTTAALGV